MKFEKRKTWYFKNNKSIRINVYGWNSNPAVKMSVDGCEREIQFHLGLFIGLYITFERFLPSSWYPTEKSETYGKLCAEKEIYIRIHGGSIWWTFWRDPNVWESKDWRNSNFNFKRLLIGNYKYSSEEVDFEDFILPYYEGNYSVRSIKSNVHIKYNRRFFWFLDKKGTRFEVKAGYQDGGVFIEKPIPHEGKGENSWDCGEDATYSSTFGMNTIRGHRDAVLEFWKSTMNDRIRYGGKKWLPNAHKDKSVEFLKN